MSPKWVFLAAAICPLSIEDPAFLHNLQIDIFYCERYGNLDFNVSFSSCKSLIVAFAISKSSLSFWMTSASDSDDSWSLTNQSRFKMSSTDGRREGSVDIIHNINADYNVKIDFTSLGSDTTKSSGIIPFLKSPST